MGLAILFEPRFALRAGARSLVVGLLAGGCLLPCLLRAALPQAEPSSLTLTGPAMGTTFQLKFAPASASKPLPPPAVIESEVREILDRLNRQMSTYHPASELSLFNQCDLTNWFSVSADVAVVFQMAQTVSERSSGAFDITVGPLVELWGFGPQRRPTQVPEASQLEQQRQRVGFRRVSVQTNPPRLRKDLAAVHCDLSAIAKGYGVDQLAEHLETLGLRDFLVEIGGEVRARGRNPAGEVWRVGIQDPENPEGLRRIVRLRDRSMATSGDYFRYFEQDGKRYSHTIDPRTGWPAAHALASVSVVHDSCAMADAWATALNVLGPEEGWHAALREGLAVLWISRTPAGLTERSTPAFDNWLADQTGPAAAEE